MLKSDKYWYDPFTNTFKKLPEAVKQQVIDYDQVNRRTMYGIGIPKLGLKQVL
jgi:hypothetical protein